MYKYKLTFVIELNIDIQSAYTAMRNTHCQMHSNSMENLTKMKIQAMPAKISKSTTTKNHIKILALLDSKSVTVV